MYMNNGYSSASTKNGVNLTSSSAAAATTSGATTSSSGAQTQSLIKAYFKTPEGRYKLHSEKTRPANLLPYSYAKTISQVTLAQLKERPNQAAAGPVPGNIASGSVRHAAARLLGVGAGNGSKALSYLGGGSSKTSNGSSRSAHFGGLGSNGYGAHSSPTSSHGGKGSFLVFNVGDTIYICDLNSPDKDPIKALHFSNSNPVCHAFDSEAKDGHDLLIGLSSGDIYSASLRQQLQDSGKKLVGALHYNKECSVNTSRCTSIAWVPKGSGTFIAAHADGNLYEYEKGKDSTGDTSFPVIKDPAQFSVYHARSSKSNPISRWHICEGSINSIVYSPDGTYLATVGRDGYLRVFDYSKEQLIGGGKSYYGSLLCCTWSPDGKYVLTGGEDDLVTVWSMEDRKVVAWGEGHNSWVSGVAFDSHWSSPTSDGTEENLVYRFGSVGQDTKLLLWELSMDEIVVPLRRCSVGGSPTFSTGSQSSHWDSSYPVGTLQPAPSMRDVPKLSPLVAHCVHTEPLSSLAFTQEAILTASWEGHVKIWMRPGEPESKSINSEALPGASLRDQLPPTGKSYSESLRGYPLPESKSNNSQALLGASSKEQQPSTGKGGAFSYKDFSKSNRYLP
ncbi:putative transcription factor WD40-like family [Rosa chinensis]|uniref:Putative transcription factor WD40-like family n=1 Tax=Rosa chinensis TaxID=74649 RepID=A0A2P6QHH6_ROSCH|nr:probable catabolite repression protein creC [Rosa chinensis]PRQ33631.1 putative transcription factor WD40-like family [Rosa chinensis]